MAPVPDAAVGKHAIDRVSQRPGLRWMNAWSLAACWMYALVFVEPKYVSGFLVLSGLQSTAFFGARPTWT